MLRSGQRSTGSWGHWYVGIPMIGREPLPTNTNSGCLIYSDPRDDGTVTETNGYAAYVFLHAASLT